jgi:hypothetical protein
MRATSFEKNKGVGFDGVRYPNTVESEQNELKIASPQPKPSSHPQISSLTPPLPRLLVFILR